MSDEAPLGRRVEYPDQYAPDLLYPISRQEGRASLGLSDTRFFRGYDLWHAYEISWLTLRGKPVVAVGTFQFPADSPNLIESKSFKLYLNSLNSMRYDSSESVTLLLKRDLERASGASVEVHLATDASAVHANVGALPGRCIDDEDVEMTDYEVNPKFLVEHVRIEPEVEETLHSHLLKSNCPVTGQPDWASVLIRYQGVRMNYAGLLKYIISYRNHHEFHESCVERMFLDLLHYCRPEKLTLSAHYTRRGGLDINPFRSNFEDQSPTDSLRLWRQ